MKEFKKGEVYTDRHGYMIKIIGMSSIDSYVNFRYMSHSIYPNNTFSFCRTNDYAQTLIKLPKIKQALYE